MSAKTSVAEKDMILTGLNFFPLIVGMYTILSWLVMGDFMQYWRGELPLIIAVGDQLIFNRLLIFLTFPIYLGMTSALVRYSFYIFPILGLVIRNIANFIGMPFPGEKKNSLSNAVTKENNVGDYWIIHGRKYNLHPFMKFHPGGRWPLQMTKNSDCTNFYENCHPFMCRQKLGEMLKKYEIQGVENVSPFDGDKDPFFMDPLAEDLRQMIRNHFASTVGREQTSLERRSLTKMKTFNKMVCLGFLLSEVFGVYLLISGKSLAWGTLITAWSGWLAMCHMCHDASHFSFTVANDFSFSKGKFNLGNRVCSFLGSFPFQVNSSAWWIQHVVSHHNNTNTEEDVDLTHFAPLIRCSRFTKYNSITHPIQLFLLIVILAPTTLHLSIAVPVDLLLAYYFHRKTPAGDKEEELPKKSIAEERYSQVAHLGKLVETLRGSMLFEVACLIFLVSYAIAKTGNSLFEGVTVFAVVYFISGWLFIIFTQGAHVREDCHTVERTRVSDEPLETSFPKINNPMDELYPRPPLDDSSEKKLVVSSFVRMQLATAVDFSTDSKFWYWISGGLNMQSLHHCIPQLSHSHFMDIYPKYKVILKKHGLAPKSVSSFWQFLYDFFNWIYVLSSESPAVIKKQK